MERITYGKKILKILGAVLGVFVFLVVALSMCAAVMDWEFRALLTDILAAMACLIGIGFAADIAYLIWAYTTERGKWAAGKAVGISYHRMHGVFCEREGWEVEFDYKLWDTYR